MSAEARHEADELAAAYARGEIGDAEWFAGMAAIFADAYAHASGRRGGSGFGGDEARWELARRPIADAVERPGSFLDVGCAAGDLLESLVRRSPHLAEPFGLELAPELAELARTRFPAWADRIFVGNVFDWTPPQRFDYVRTELSVDAPEGGGTILELAALDA